jgi:hypothetical protein
MSYIRNLLDEFRLGNAIAAEELADFVEHILDQPGLSVAVAFGLQDEQRPAEPTPIWVRDPIIQEFAATLGDISIRAQAKAVIAAARRPPASDEGTKHESLLANRLNEIGVGDLSERTVSRILGGH